MRKFILLALLGAVSTVFASLSNDLHENDASALITIHNITPKGTKEIWLSRVTAKMSTATVDPCSNLATSFSMSFYAPPDSPQLWAINDKNTYINEKTLRNFVKEIGATCMQLEFIYNNRTYIAGPFTLISDLKRQLYTSATPKTFILNFN